MLFLDNTFMFFPMVLLFLLYKSNIMYREMDKTIHGNYVYIQPAFSAYRTQLIERTSPPFERA